MPFMMELQPASKFTYYVFVYLVDAFQIRETLMAAVVEDSRRCYACMHAHLDLHSCCGL